MILSNSIVPQKHAHTNSCMYFKFIFHVSFIWAVKWWISISKVFFFFATASFLLFFPPWHKPIIFLWHLQKLISFNLFLPLPNAINIQYSTCENQFLKKSIIFSIPLPVTVLLLLLLLFIHSHFLFCIHLPCGQSRKRLLDIDKRMRLSTLILIWYNSHTAPSVKNKIK